MKCKINSILLMKLFMIYLNKLHFRFFTSEPKVQTLISIIFKLNKNELFSPNLASEKYTKL